MRQVEYARFGFVQRNLFRACELESVAELSGQDPEIYNDPEIVQETAEVRFLRLREINLARKVTAYQCAAQ